MMSAHSVWVDGVCMTARCGGGDPGDGRCYSHRTAFHLTVTGLDGHRERSVVTLFICRVIRAGTREESGSCGPMDKAPDFGSGDCRFKSCHDRNILMTTETR